MKEKLLEFFEEIKEFRFWKKQWVKKLVYDNNGVLKGIYERKFRKQELKEICKDGKNGVVNIKEYRYGEDELLKKIVVKDNEGTLQYINEIIYDEDNKIQQIETTTIEGKTRFKRILNFCKTKLESEEITIDDEKICLADIKNLDKQWVINLDKNLIQLVYKDGNKQLYKFSYAIRDAMIFDFNIKNENISFKEGNLFNFSDVDDIKVNYDKNNTINKVQYMKCGQELITIEYLFE